MRILSRRHIYEKLVRKYDIIYIPRFSYPLIPIAKSVGKKVIVHLHDYQPISYTAVIMYREDLDPMNDIRRTLILGFAGGSRIFTTLASAAMTPLTKLIRYWVNLSDVIICVSKRHGEIISNLVPEYRGKIRVIYNPLPPILNITKKLSPTPTLLYTGGDNFIKGFHSLLIAIHRILEKGYKMNFILTKNYNSSSLYIVKKLNAIYGNTIDVVGYVSYREVLKLHQQSWALLFPSIWEEPLPYTVIESMLLGTLPITSKVGGVPEIVQGTPAEKFMLIPGKAEELISRIEDVLSMSVEQLMDIGMKLRESIVKKFNNEFTIHQFMNVFSL